MQIEPKMKTRYVMLDYTISSYGSSKEEWIKFINDSFEKVPEEYRISARLDADGSDDGHINWDVYYESPETNEEMEGARQRQMFIEAQEKDQLRKLMEKYPDDSTARRV